MHMIPEHTGCVICDKELKECTNFRLPESGNTAPQTSKSQTSVRSPSNNNSQQLSTHFSERNNSRRIPNTESSKYQSGESRSFLSSQGASKIFGEMNDVVVCNCDTDAKMVEVRKEGPNKGRKFYTCSSGTCRFFLWADEPKGPSSQSNEIKCKCGAIVKKLTCKSGQNKGRPFVACPKDRCGFFEWQDISSSQSNQSQSISSQFQTKKISVLNRQSMNYFDNSLGNQSSASNEEKKCMCGEVATL